MNESRVIPQTVDTYNIKESLVIFARLNKAPIENVDFWILKTLTKAIDASTASEIVVYEAEDSVALPDSYMENPTYKLKQLHTIKMLAKESHSNDFKLGFLIDKNCSLVTIVLRKESIIVKEKALENDLYQAILKTLAYNGIILYHFDEDLRNQVFGFVRYAKNGVQEYDTTFIAARAFKYESPEPDEIDYIYKNTKSMENEFRVNTQDLYDQHYMKEAKQGDVLVAYKKPKDGRAGRNCRGAYLEAVKALEIYAPRFTYDENSVYRTEYQDKIIYTAKKEGFVDIINNILSVGDDVSVYKIGARETGVIRTKESRDTKLNVLESDPIVDAIGPSMTVSVAKLRVNGSVANHAKLYAKEVEIGGMTHATSYITAENFVKIKHHRGVVESPRVEIESLEGGVVSGDTVSITVAHHGTVRARNVTIQKLCSNCRIIASESIIVEDIEGDENDLYINPAATLHNEIRIEDCKKSIHVLTHDIVKLEEALDSLNNTISINKTNVAKIMANKNPHMSDIHKAIVQRFKESLNKLKKTQIELDSKKDARKRHRQDLDKALYSVFDARIKIMSASSSKQTIRFRCIDDKDYYYALKDAPIGLKIIQTPSNKFVITLA